MDNKEQEELKVSLINLLEAALEKAAQAGVYSLKESANINFALQNLKLDYVKLSEQGKEADASKAEKSPSKRVKKV